MLAGAGIRTKSTTAARFAPGAYHNGSVWPVDTGVIADGLRRHGYVSEAADLDDRVLRACARVGGPVEFFRGDADGKVAINVSSVEVELAGARVLLEQPPQLVQGWTVTRLWRILRGRGIAPSPLAHARHEPDQTSLGAGTKLAFDQELLLRRGRARDSLARVFLERP
jgi:glycogen debranching enzyme